MLLSTPFQDSRWPFGIGQCVNFPVFWRENPGIFWPVSWSVGRHQAALTLQVCENTRSPSRCSSACPISVQAGTGRRAGCRKCQDCLQPGDLPALPWDASQLSCLSLALRRFLSVVNIGSGLHHSVSGALHALMSSLLV